MICETCRALAAHRPNSLTLDCDLQIRSWVGAQGWGAAHMMELDAADAKRAYEQDVSHPRACCRSRAPAALRAWRRYALTAWVLRRLEAAWEQQQATKKADRETLAGLPLAELLP